MHVWQNSCAVKSFGKLNQQGAQNQFYAHFPPHSNHRKCWWRIVCKRTVRACIQTQNAQLVAHKHTRTRCHCCTAVDNWFCGRFSMDNWRRICCSWFRKFHNRSGNALRHASYFNYNHSSCLFLIYFSILTVAASSHFVAGL